ncbi:MAG TPA: CapA family protein [Chthoniobacterales bacterium]|nr:CapA family protein [Chthoniobacterales bacterium]
MRPRWLALAVFVACALPAGAARITVPIYLEDSHAGSFYWLAEHLDLDEQYTLVHFDAHSDASGIFDSDRIRERLRRVGSLEERQQLLASWRAAGAVQCYNWIEPLMPAPISRVIWVSGRKRPEQKEAIEQLDGHLEAAPRAAGSFREHYQAVSFDRLRAEMKEDGPVIVSIDLDYFADIATDRRASEFERVWRFVAECRNLRAVTIAVSRPYLKDDEQADDLLRLALEASLSLPTAAIQFEPFQKVGNDRSLRAREFQKRKEEVPAFSLAKSSEKMRAVLLANRDRILTRTRNAAWEQQLDEWKKETPEVRLTVKDREPSTDGIWRVPVSDSAEVELETEPSDAAVERIEWIALKPEYPRCNLTAKRADEIGFASGAPPRPRWRENRLVGAGTTISVTDEIGAVRLKARVVIGGHLRETRPIEVRRFSSAGFRAALTEQFRLPYLFGSGELRDGVETGPETGFGADCANFVVYALRRQGQAVPWSNPKQLRKHLERLAVNAQAGGTPVGETDVGAGLIVHFGNHVAAVMEDRPPRGTLGRNDLVAHQLEGMPEIVSLGKLLSTRKTNRFDLYRVWSPKAEPDLLFGGDVMLGRTVGAAIEQGLNPFGGIQPRLERSSSNLVNLECVLSEKGTASRAKRYSFRAPIAAGLLLRLARIDAVSLANNHATDFGEEALLDSIVNLKASEIASVGAGATTERAFAPHFFTTPTGRRTAVIALDDTTDDVGRGLIARARDRAQVSDAITEARAGASFVFCFVHWGEENTVKVTERQRELARWLIDHGVDAVAGSHPHCIQPFDSYRGRPIFYSLGNLIFDGAPTLPGWNRGHLVEFDLGKTRAPLFRLVPVRLDARGFPELAEANQTSELRWTDRNRQKDRD